MRDTCSMACWNSTRSITAGRTDRPLSLGSESVVHLLPPHGLLFSSPLTRVVLVVLPQPLVQRLLQRLSRGRAGVERHVVRIAGHEGVEQQWPYIQLGLCVAVEEGGRVLLIRHGGCAFCLEPPPRIPHTSGRSPKCLCTTCGGTRQTWPGRPPTPGGRTARARTRAATGAPPAAACGTRPWSCGRCPV